MAIKIKCKARKPGDKEYKTYVAELLEYASDFKTIKVLVHDSKDVVSEIEIEPTLGAAVLLKKLLT
jgi:hypothetical protein